MKKKRRGVDVTIHVPLEPDLCEYIRSRAGRERRTATGLVRFLIHQAAEAEKQQQQTATA